MNISINVVISKQLEVIQKLQAEVLAEPTNAYTSHKVDTLREATIALVSLATVKQSMEGL